MSETAGASGTASPTGAGAGGAGVGAAGVGRAGVGRATGTGETRPDHGAAPAGGKTSAPRTARRPVAVLMASQLLAGVGVASGVAVGGVMAETLSGSASAGGTAQTASIVGAGLVAGPLAGLASRSGRRSALAAGFALGALGAALVVSAAVAGWYWLLLVGMLLVGAATAAGLQARYAAAEQGSTARRGRTISLVVWATTVGGVLGPNLSAPGSDLGQQVGVPAPGGPFLISLLAFVLATAVLLVGLPRPPGRRLPSTDPSTAPADPGHPDTAAAGAQPAGGVVVAETSSRPLRAHRVLVRALRDPATRLGIVAVVCGHAMMVSVMVMTPVHMNHQEMGLELIGLVISLHVLGMYAASPVFGWLTDRFGSTPVLGLGVGLFLLAFLGGAFSPEHHHGDGPWWLAAALVLLGLGWSACLIAGSSLLAAGASAEQLKLQGSVDAAMNLGAALLAGLSGPVLALGGYPAVNLLGGVVLVVLVIVGITSLRSRSGSGLGGSA